MIGLFAATERKVLLRSGYVYNLTLVMTTNATQGASAMNDLQAALLGIALSLPVFLAVFGLAAFFPL